jgi:hypothetical protein
MAWSPTTSSPAKSGDELLLMGLRLREGIDGRPSCSCRSPSVAVRRSSLPGWGAPAGAAGLAAQVVFALLPLVVARRA